jgi:Glyoxalase-like domain
MSRLIKSSCFDAAAALALARFWASVFGSDVDEGSTMIWPSSRPLAEVVRISGSQRFLSQGREEPDAFRPEGSRYRRGVQAGKLGSTVVRSHRGHTAMQETEGNEFCSEPGSG